MIGWCISGNLAAGTLIGLRHSAVLGEHVVQCRAGCGACCIAPSITSAIPEMPVDGAPSLARGKAAGVRCVQLTHDNRCAIFADPRRPSVCATLRASLEMCGANEDVAATRVHAMQFLTALELATR